MLPSIEFVEAPFFREIRFLFVLTELLSIKIWHDQQIVRRKSACRQKTRKCENKNKQSYDSGNIEVGLA